MANSNTNAVELGSQMNQLQTVAAAKSWWNSKSPAQKAAVIGIITATGIGGYAFYATYATAGIGSALWASILYGGVAGAATTIIAQAHFTPAQYASATKNLGDNL